LSTDELRDMVSQTDTTQVKKKIDDTIPKLIRRNYEQWADDTAMCMKKFGIWQKYTWRQYYDTVRHLSLGLLSLGLEKGDVVAIIGDNEPEWFWGEFATQAAQGIATGIFVDSIPSEVKYVAEHSGAKFAIVNDQEQTDKFLEVKDQLPSLKKIIYWDPKGLKNYDAPFLIGFNDVLKLGREYEKTHPDLFQQNVDAGSGKDIACIYYTSGTTGLPKGALMTHRALINTAKGFVSRYPIDEMDNLISNFPAAWVGDSYFATIPHILTGAVLNFPEEPETIADDTREAGPNFAIYGPRQWESVVSEIQVKMMDAHPIKRFAYRFFLPVGHWIADKNFKNQQPGLWLRLLYQPAYYLLFRPLKDKLGLINVRFAVTGSSVLSLDTFRLIHAIGIELRQNYASTEAGLISSHGKGEIDFESVGRPAVGTEVRVMNSGELLVRSDSMFSGYHCNPEKTKEVLIDGWCHTADAVNINEKGHLIFLDRLDHMGELKSGVKYAPQYTEGRLRFSPYIKDAMVIGNKNNDYVAAIINMDFTMVGKWAEKNHLAYTTFVDLSQKDQVAALVQKDLIRVNGYLPEAARVRKFVLMHKEFDPDEAELTRTRKLRREFIETRYADLINAMYSGTDEVQVVASVTYRDGRKGTVTTGVKIRTVKEGSK
jgi:long-chain acyl-CoA synthetase